HWGAHDRGSGRPAAPAAAPAAAFAPLTGAFSGRGRTLAARAGRAGWRHLIGSRRRESRTRDATIRRDGLGRPGHLSLAFDGRTIHHRAFERARPPLTEVDPRIERFHTHPEVLHLNAEPRDFDNQVVNQLVVQL